MTMADVECEICGHLNSEHEPWGDGDRCTHPGCDIVTIEPCTRGAARRDDLTDKIKILEEERDRLVGHFKVVSKSLDAHWKIASAWDSHLENISLNVRSALKGYEDKK